MVEKTLEWKKVCEDHVDSLFLQLQGEFTNGFKERVRRLFLEVLFVLEKPLNGWLGKLEGVIIIEGGCCRRLIGLEPLPGEEWEHRYQIILSLSACDRSDEGLKRLFAHELAHLALNHCLERERLGSVCIEKQEKEAEEFCKGMGF